MSTKYRDKVVLVLCIAAYIVAGGLLLPYYRYQINPDGISYISIAQQYLRGDFTDAINGYWGPMLSWLLVPLLFLGVEPLVAVKILTLAIGLIALIGVWLLSFKFDMPDSIRKLMPAILTPLIITFALMTITPDILIVCLLVYYFLFIFDQAYSSKLKQGLLCGLFGSLAYLSKSAAFPFFILHFLTFNLIHYIRSKSWDLRKGVIRNFTFGMAIFGVISGLWISAITVKYGELTFSTSGGFNRALNAPEPRGYPMDEWGFIEPPNETAISAWDDPSYFKLKGWSPFDSWASFKYQVVLILRNFKTWAIICPGLFPLFLPTILIGIFFFLPFDKRALDSSIFYAVMTIALYCGMYSLVVIISRYLWIVYLLTMLIGGQILGKIFVNKYFNNQRKGIALIILFLLLTAMPFKYLYQHINDTERIYKLSKVLKSEGIFQARIASNEAWDRSLYVAFHLKSRYYGRAKPDVTDEELKSDLEKFNIEYYFEWDSSSVFVFLSDYQEITGGEIPNLHVYRIKPVNNAN
jgi:hypothetical protein